MQDIFLAYLMCDTSCGIHSVRMFESYPPNKQTYFCDCTLCIQNVSNVCSVHLISAVTRFSQFVLGNGQKMEMIYQNRMVRCIISEAIFRSPCIFPPMHLLRLCPSQLSILFTCLYHEIFVRELVRFYYMQFLSGFQYLILEVFVILPIAEINSNFFLFLTNFL
jgi:hypothetical protein